MESSAYVRRIAPTFCLQELKAHYLIHTEWRGVRWLVIASTCGCADLHSRRESSPFWLGGLARKKRFFVCWHLHYFFFLLLFFPRWRDKNVPKSCKLVSGSAEVWWRVTLWLETLEWGESFWRWLLAWNDLWIKCIKIHIRPRVLNTVFKTIFYCLYWALNI